MEKQNNKPFTSIKDFAELSGLSVYFVRQLVSQGKIPVTRSGVKIYIDTERALEILRGDAD